MIKTISIKVEGKVQGVFYRKSTQQKAQALGITGEVRNNKDGSVSLMATGHPQVLQELVDWCKTGPARAEVDAVTVREEATQAFEDFRIIRG